MGVSDNLNVLTSEQECRKQEARKHDISNTLQHTTVSSETDRNLKTIYAMPEKDIKILREVSEKSQENSMKSVKMVLRN